MLKRKSDAIKMRLHDILSKIKQVKLDVGYGMMDAAEAHDNAIWSAGDFNHTVIEGVTDASFRVRADIINVAGVRIPKFERALDDVGGQATQTTMVGFSRGGEQVQAAQVAYSTVLDKLVQLAVLQTSLQALDAALKVTNRRVNALEFLLIPQLENTLVYVESELFEMEREDAYRVKKVKDMRAAEQDAEDAAEDAAEERRAILASLERKKQQQLQQKQGGSVAPEPVTQVAPEQNKKSSKKSKNAAVLDSNTTQVDAIMQASAKDDAAIANLF